MIRRPVSLKRLASDGEDTAISEFVGESDHSPSPKSFGLCVRGPSGHTDLSGNYSTNPSKYR